MEIINIEYRRIYSANGIWQVVEVGVLTVDRSGQRAVYMGCVVDADSYRGEAYAEDIAANGRKLSYNEALGYFPGLEEKQYRR